MSASTSNPNTHIHPHTDSDPNCTLEGALKTIVNVYHHYAPREGKDDELSYKDLTQLLQNQAPTFLEACGRNRPGYISELFKKLDRDQSGNLSFEETITIIAMLTDDFHRISHNEDRCGPARD